MMPGKSIAHCAMPFSRFGRISDLKQATNMSNSHEYIEARQRFDALKEEYERKLTELDPLRWRMEDARRAADEAWKLIMCRT